MQALVVELTTPCTPGCRGKDGTNGEVAPGNVFSFQHLMPVGNDPRSVNRSDSKDSNSAKIQKTIASKENILSKTALRVLHSKRDELVLNQRPIEDKIAQYDKKIQTIMSGGDDDLELKIDSIVEGCDNIKRGHLSEEVVEMPSPCWASLTFKFILVFTICLWSFKSVLPTLSDGFFLLRLLLNSRFEI
ncbi:hypothetical protein SLE2022_085240 [Rubroshorea leprosula]